jgi:hypothetical protein
MIFVPFIAFLGLVAIEYFGTEDKFTMLELRLSIWVFLGPTLITAFLSTLSLDYIEIGKKSQSIRIDWLCRAKYLRLRELSVDQMSICASKQFGGGK